MKRHLNLAVLGLVWLALFPPCAYIMTHGPEANAQAAAAADPKNQDWNNQRPYSREQQAAIDKHIKAWKEARANL